MYAVERGNTDAVRLIIRSGGNVNPTYDDHHETPLMRAAAEGYADIVGVLLANGANVNVKDDRGNTALKYAQDATYASDGDHHRIVSMLKQAGAK